MAQGPSSGITTCLRAPAMPARGPPCSGWVSGLPSSCLGPEPHPSCLLWFRATSSQAQPVSETEGRTGGGKRE